ncbi:MAG TPA: hypothetical protein VD902_05280 [Symbiobacteriaceae bacterium]|nr:hypothetical protein [Symbiobacteriaceae bacterium]
MEDRRYAIELEIVEGDCPPHPTGARYRYPQQMGEMCPWLMDAMGGMLRVLSMGGTLDWQYPGTPYEKQIDPDGITTEFVRCPDPTARGVVVKITRRAVYD